MDTNDLLSEIDDLQTKLEDLSKKPAMSTSTHFSWPSLFTGFFFYFLFLFSLGLNLPFAHLISLLSFGISTVALLVVVADIVRGSANWAQLSALKIAFVPILVILVAVNTYLMWSEVLLSYTLPLFFVFAAIVGVQTIFFGLNALLSYYRNEARYELAMTFGILVITWILLLALGLYNSVILYILLIAAIVLLSKALIDFSGRFVRK